MFLLLFVSAMQVATPLPAPTTQTAPAQATPFGESARLPQDQLGAATARENIGQLARADQAAQVSNNRINGNSVTGAVSISDNAFQNLSGLAVISANSGNNVAINSALNVNVTIRPQ